MDALSLLREPSRRLFCSYGVGVGVADGATDSLGAGLAESVGAGFAESSGAGVVAVEALGLGVGSGTPGPIVK